VGWKFDFTNKSSKIAAALGKFYGGISISAGEVQPQIYHLGSQSITVQILGEVNAAGTFSYVTGKYDECLYLSGGPNEIGTFRKVNLVRNNEVYYA
jgi:hypothetical protein